MASVADNARAVPAVAALEAPIARVADADRVFLVGGAVRDLLRGSTTLDLDLTVEGDGVGFARRLAAALRAGLVVHDAFATATITTPERTFDVVTARSERYTHPGALPAVERASLRDDLARRDFTVNAMAISLNPDAFGALHDPFAGRDDLTARRLRVLHDKSFTDDPTRILRGVRYEIRLGFALDPDALRLARDAVAHGALATLSGARLRDALILTLAEPQAAAAVLRLADLGVVWALHPALRGDDETSRLIGRYDAFVAAHPLEHRAYRGRLAVAARRFGPDALAAWLDQLAFSRRDTRVITAAALQAEPGAQRLAAAGPDPVAALRVFRGQPGEVVAGVAAQDPQAAVIAARWLDEWRHVTLSIDGSDVLRLAQQPAGAWVGRVLDTLLEHKLAGDLPDRDAELAAARALAAGAGNQSEGDKHDRDQRGGEGSPEHD